MYPKRSVDDSNLMLWSSYKHRWSWYFPIELFIVVYNIIFPETETSSQYFHKILFPFQPDTDWKFGFVHFWWKSTTNEKKQQQTNKQKNKTNGSSTCCLISWSFLYRKLVVPTVAGSQGNPLLRALSNLLFCLCLLLIFCDRLLSTLVTWALQTLKHLIERRQCLEDKTREQTWKVTNLFASVWQGVVINYIRFWETANLPLP